MLLAALVAVIFVALIAGLIAGAVAIRRRQRALAKTREATQLQRRADHLFKIALAAQVHTRNNAIAHALLDEAVRVLEYALQLDPQVDRAAGLLRECQELLANIAAEPRMSAIPTDSPCLDFPESELIEAQMHLTEATRLLIGLEKRGRVSYDELSEMTVALKQAHRAIDLRLQLYQAAHALEGDRGTPKPGEAAQTGEYVGTAEASRATQSHG